MTRKLKTIGAALVAAIASVAVGASAASAANFTAAEYPVTLNGSQAAGVRHVFSITGSTVECGVATFSGSASAASSTQTIAAGYSECLVFGLFGSVETNGCDYLLHLATGSATDGTVDIVCPEGKEMTMYAGPKSSPICTLHIPGVGTTAGSPINEGLATMTYANNSPHIDVTAEISNLQARITKNSIFCPLAATAPGQYDAATYDGRITLKGSKGGVNDSIDIG